MRFTRSSGILLHPTSLPGPFGIGDLGDEAYRFVDFLAAAGQAYWQVMPLGPPGYGDSPYASVSAFAGNVNLVSPRELVASGFLAESDIQDTAGLSARRPDDGKATAYKRRLLEKAFQNFKGQIQGDRALQRDWDRIRELASVWLDEYALFAALKDEYHGAEWLRWDTEVAAREPGALERARRDLAHRVEQHRFFQYVFLRQWLRLKQYANDKGVRVIGDMPIFVAHDSADVWARPHLWKLAGNGRPMVVSGVPPDVFSAVGQLWGSPLYAWERMREDGFAWWTNRVRETLKLVDLVRLDHFRGFTACWEVPAGDRTAERGRWVEVPGRDLFRAIEHARGTRDLPIIAEDLGTITSDVHRLREELDFPGMRVLQFAFSGDPHDTHLPHEYPRDVVAYTGTHDNDTVVGWFQHRSREGATDSERRERDNCLRYLGTDGAEINWDFIRAVQMSVADIAVVPLPDVLGLDSAARMNTPGTACGNWSWRLERDGLTDASCARLRLMTAVYGRLARDRSVVPPLSG